MHIYKLKKEGHTDFSELNDADVMNAVYRDIVTNKLSITSNRAKTLLLDCCLNVFGNKIEESLR